MTRFRQISLAGLILALLGALTPLLLPPASAAQDDALPAVKDAPDEAAERDNPAPAEDEEPPLEFTLDVDGETVGIQLDRAATLEIGGKQVEVRLTAKPDRLFRGGGISFRYPRDHGFAVERDGAETSWTLDGTDNITVLIHYRDGADPDELARATVEAVVAQHGKDKCRTRPSTIALGKHVVEGTRIDIPLDDAMLVQEFFVWRPREGGPTYFLMLQDTPPEPGATSDETKQVRELLGRTFKHDKPAPKE